MKKGLILVLTLIAGAIVGAGVYAAICQRATDKARAALDYEIDHWTAGTKATVTYANAKSIPIFGPELVVTDLRIQEQGFEGSLVVPKLVIHHYDAATGALSFETHGARILSVEVARAMAATMGLPVPDFKNSVQPFELAVVLDPAGHGRGAYTFELTLDGLFSLAAALVRANDLGRYGQFSSADIVLEDLGIFALMTATNGAQPDKLQKSARAWMARAKGAEAAGFEEAVLRETVQALANTGEINRVAISFTAAPGYPYDPARPFASKGAPATPLNRFADYAISVE